MMSNYHLSGPELAASSAEDTSCNKNNKRKAEKLVDGADVGRIGRWTEVQTIWCRFHDFANLPHKREDDSEASPLLWCHGYEWIIEVYPGGDEHSNEKTPHVSISLAMNEAKLPSNGIKVRYSIRIPDGYTGLPATYNTGETDTPTAIVTFTKDETSWTYHDYAERAHVLDHDYAYLDPDGAILIKVDIQIYVNDAPTWSPKKKLQVDMLQLLESADGSDVTFAVGDAKFPAHRAILLARAPILATMAEDTNGADVDVSDIVPESFRSLLRFVYGDEVPPVSNCSEARAILKAADRFGCTKLKLSVEAEVVKSILGIGNAAEWIAFADAHCCALLKEAAVNVFVSHTSDVRKSPGWPALKESAKLLDELMEAQQNGVQVDSEVERGGIKSLSVSSLRERLDEKGLDVDGTREMLVERLEKAVCKTKLQDCDSGT